VPWALGARPAERVAAATKQERDTPAAIAERGEAAKAAPAKQEGDKAAAAKAKQPELVKVAQRKMSFCLRDSRRVPAHMGEFNYAERYGACSRNSPQGISVGWVDVYQSYLAGQAIKLPRRMGDGLYCLRIKVDPQDQLLETDEKDNSSVRAFFMRGDRISYRDSEKCHSRG
jgi:hypothetical protein